MNNIDYCIGKYFADHFECPDLVFLSRDHGIEERLIAAGKAEYILRKDNTILKDLLGYDPERLGIFIDSNGAIYKQSQEGLISFNYDSQEKLKEWQLAKTGLQKKLVPKEYPYLYHLFSFELIYLYLLGGIERLKNIKLLYGLLKQVVFEKEVSSNNEQGQVLEDSYSIPSKYYNDVDKFFPSIEVDEWLFGRNQVYILNNTVVINAQKRKIVLPFCSIPPSKLPSKHQKFNLPFWPSKSYPLQGADFDLKRLCEPEYCDAKIILTDSATLAAHNQIGLVKSNNKDILWLYWHGGKDVVPNIDLEPLKGRTVYYLLIKHSGLCEEQVLEIGECIEKRLKLIEVKELKIISYMHMHSPGEKDLVPSIFSSIHEVKTKLKYYIPDLENFQSQHVSEVQERKAIVTPVILDKTFTVAYGNNSTLNSWFAQLIATSSVIGRNAIEDWGSACKPQKVVFCYNDRIGETNYLENIDLIFRILTGRKPYLGPYGNKITIGNLIDKNIIMLYPFTHFNDLDFFISYKTEGPKILVIDDLRILSNNIVDFESTVRVLNRNGWTVILTIQTSKQFNNAMVKNITAHNYLEIKQLNFAKSLLSFSVSTDTILRSFSGINTFRCEFDFGFDPPTLRKLPLSQSELETLGKKIAMMRHRKPPTPWKKIARRFDISINKARRLSFDIIIT